MQMKTVIEEIFLLGIRGEQILNLKLRTIIHTMIRIKRLLRWVSIETLDSPQRRISQGREELSLSSNKW